MQKKIDKFTDEEILNFIKESRSFRQLLIKLGYSSNGSGDYVYVKKKLDDKKIDYSNLFKLQTPNENIVPLNENGKIIRTYNNVDLFVVDCKVGRSVVKNRIIGDNLIPYICNNCGLKNEWNGKKLSLQLEHKNGINNDNRLENLCFLCPNCHSQTETFGSKRFKKIKNCECGVIIHRKSKFCVLCAKKHTNMKNQFSEFNFNLISEDLKLLSQEEMAQKYNITKGTVKRWIKKCKKPPIEDLIQDIKKIGYTKTGEKYGVSDNAIRKWVKGYGLDPKDIKK